MEKGGKTANVRVASPEKVPIYINTIALRKAKIVYNFGLSECNRVNKSTACRCQRSAVAAFRKF